MTGERSAGSTITKNKALPITAERLRNSCRRAIKAWRGRIVGTRSNIGCCTVN
jgi:hypothetical protein